MARDKPSGSTKFLNKYAAFSLLMVDEWLLDEPDESTRSMLLELLERCYDQASTVFCSQYAQEDWHQRLGSGVHADAIMDRIVHNTIWVETGVNPVIHPIAGKYQVGLCLFQHPGKSFV